MGGSAHQVLWSGKPLGGTAFGVCVGSDNHTEGFVGPSNSSVLVKMAEMVERKRVYLMDYGRTWGY